MSPAVYEFSVPLLRYTPPWCAASWPPGVSGYLESAASRAEAKRPRAHHLSQPSCARPALVDGDFSSQHGVFPLLARSGRGTEQGNRFPASLCPTKSGKPRPSETIGMPVRSVPNGSRTWDGGDALSGRCGHRHCGCGVMHHGPRADTMTMDHGVCGAESWNTLTALRMCRQHTVPVTVPLEWPL